LGVDVFGQDFGGYPSKLLRRTAEALLVAHPVLGGFPCASASRPLARPCDGGSRSTNLAVMIGEITLLIRAPEGTPATFEEFPEHHGKRLP